MCIFPDFHFGKINNVEEVGKLMKIGILGFDFESPNKGCEALTYSFINMLIECFGNDLKIINYSYGGLGAFQKQYPD